MDLLKSYFNGDVPAKQLGRRAREIASQHFTRSDEFYAFAIAAFQSAIDAAHTQQTKQDERKLLSAMAALKREFGLTDLYQVEAWRPWRE